MNLEYTQSTAVRPHLFQPEIGKKIVDMPVKKMKIRNKGKTTNRFKFSTQARFQSVENPFSFNFQSESAHNSIKQPLAQLLDSQAPETTRKSERQLVKIMDNNIETRPELNQIPRHHARTNRCSPQYVNANMNNKKLRYSTKVSTEYGAAVRVTSPPELSGGSFDDSQQIKQDIRNMEELE